MWGCKKEMKVIDVEKTGNEGFEKYLKKGMVKMRFPNIGFILRI